MAAYNYAEGDTPAIVRHNSPQGYRTVYFAFGFENICREYDSNEPHRCYNLRGKMTHNVLCWLRTGTYTGRVLDKDGLKPIPSRPVVEILAGGPTSITENAVRCNEDGSYVVNGVRPASRYLRASAPGYYDHAESWSVHGMGSVLPTWHDFVLSKADPGSISGTVTSAASGQPLANVTVEAFEPVSAEIRGSTLTAADGTYAIEQLPNADYEVTADGTAVAHNIETQTVTVLPAQNTPNVDFALTSADGALEVTVTDSATADLIPNATVEVKDASTGALVDSGVTDANGQVSFSLPPSDYAVSAGAAGYETSADQTVTITPLVTTPITIALQEVPPGSISGLITRQTDGSLVDGVLVEVFSGGVKIAEGVSQATPIASISEQANYHIPDVKAGTHSVVATKAGLTMIPASHTVTVVSSQRTGNINFYVKPLHTFPIGLSMMSVPYDLSAHPIASLLEVPAGEVKLATYNPTTASYTYYPNPPSDVFRLGTGYWMYLDAIRDLTTSGPVATDPYRIPLLPGWNLIGAPFAAPVDYAAVMIEDSGGTPMSLQEAFRAGILQSGLFTWMFGGYRTSLSLVPYTGYWVLPFERCTLVVPRPLAAGLAAAGAQSVAVDPASAEPFRSPRDGWSMRIEVAAGEATDADNYLGVAADATDGYDTYYDVQEPPAPVGGSAITAAFVDGGAEALAADIRSSIGKSKEWTFVVSANEPDQEVRLTWPDISAIPRGYRCTLVDVDADRRVAMRTSRCYTFSSGTAGAVRRFRVAVGEAAAGGLAITNFVAADGRGAKTLSYTLSRDASVSAQVLNVAGRLVRNLGQAQQRAAGQNELIWDLRSEAGARVPNGIYLVKLGARSADGEVVGATRMVSVWR